MKIKIAYYSGTGCTEKAAHELQKSLEKHNNEVCLEHIKSGVVSKEFNIDFLVLMFPIHAFNAPAAIYDWVDEGDSGNNIPTAVISVSAGGEGGLNSGCRFRAIKKLIKKGYKVQYEDMIMMPSNFGASTEEEISLILLKVLPIKTDLIAKNIMGGVIKKNKVKFKNKFISTLGEMEKAGAKSFGKSLYADDNCISCEACANECPADNIKMENGRPIFSNKCHMCMKCIYLCPTRAIKQKKFNSAVIKEGFDLEKLIKKADTFEWQKDLSKLDNVLKDYLKDIRVI